MSNILIIDDSMTMRQMVNFTLASAGHKVTEAGNADEALAHAQTQRFDLVISDVNMPGRTGIELVAELRKLPEYKFVPIILLTTESQPEMKSKGRAAGATGWIVKPFDPEALLSVLRKVLPGYIDVRAENAIMTMKYRLLLGVAVLLVLITAMAAVGIMNLPAGPRGILVGLFVATVLLLLVMWFVTVRAITIPLTTAVSLANRVAAGDLTVRIETNGHGEFGELMLALKSMDENLTRMVSDIRYGAEAIGTSADEVAAGNNNLSQRTEEQASTLEQTASSMEQLTAAVKENTESARKANVLAKNANAVAANGGKVVGEVVVTMNDIQESSRKIADIISVIDSIAFQTNILALNAAVEAARAGEQGRGFAVVASEVRSLAQRSADAAKEIKGLIGSSVDKIEAGTRLVETAGKTMTEIVDSVARVSGIIDQISNASSEQSNGIEQVNQAIAQMEQVVQQNAAVVEQASAAADSMRIQGQRLRDVVGVFKVDENDVILLNRRRDPARDPAKVPEQAMPPSRGNRGSTAAPPDDVRPAELATPATAGVAAIPRGLPNDGEWKEF